MTATTSYGSWARIAADSCLTLDDSVALVLNHFAGDFDVPALIADYRAAINEALPEGITLNGDQFYGPYPRGDVDLAEAIEAVDFWAIVKRHDVSTT